MHIIISLSLKVTAPSPQTQTPLVPCLGEEKCPLLLLLVVFFFFFASHEALSIYSFVQLIQPKIATLASRLHHDTDLPPNHDLRPLCVDSQFCQGFKLDCFKAKYVLRWTQPPMHHFTASTGTPASHSHRPFCLSSSISHVFVYVSFRNSSRVEGSRNSNISTTYSVLILKPLLAAFIERTMLFYDQFPIFYLYLLHVI